MDEYIVLFNPKAGNGTGAQAAERIREKLPEAEIRFQDVTKIMDGKAFFNKVGMREKLVLVGGDGTINHFVNELYDLCRDRDIFYLAAGSGNDFLADLKADKDSIVRINGYLQDLPTVLVNDKEYRFINGVGFGIDGYCCEVGDRVREKSTKPVNYTSIAIKGLLFHYKPKNATITIDGVEHHYKRCWLAPTMFGSYYGGGMIPTPGQDRMNAEHKVSTLAYHNCGKLKALIVFPNIFKGEHVVHKEMCEVLRGKEVTVRFDKPCALQIDGETILNVTEYKVTTI